LGSYQIVWYSPSIVALCTVGCSTVRAQDHGRVFTGLTTCRDRPRVRFVGLKLALRGRRFMLQAPFCHALVNIKWLLKVTYNN
jgi:hypothetical protein